MVFNLLFEMMIILTKILNYHFFDFLLLRTFFQILGERLASMLNYNVTQLCGPKCVDLKVKDAQRFKWDPRKVMEQIVEVYLNLNSEQFAEHIAADEVCLVVI
jgi:hypothetical protein